MANVKCPHSMWFNQECRIFLCFTNLNDTPALQLHPHAHLNLRSHSSTCQHVDMSSDAVASTEYEYRLGRCINFDLSVVPTTNTFNKTP